MRSPICDRIALHHRNCRNQVNTKTEAPNIYAICDLKYHRIPTIEITISTRAHRVLVLSSGSLECIPMERALRSTNGECVPVLQQATKLLNDGLMLAIDRLNTRFSAPIYTISGMFPIYMNLYTNPQASGLGMPKMRAADKDPTAVLVSALPCQICAQIGATMCGGTSFIQHSALLKS